MSNIDDLLRDPNAAPIFDASGEPWTPPDPATLARILQADQDRMLADLAHLVAEEMVAVYRILGLHRPAPAPVKAKTFDEWLKSTAALLEECAERRQ